MVSRNRLARKNDKLTVLNQDGRWMSKPRHEKTIGELHLYIW